MIYLRKFLKWLFGKRKIKLVEASLPEYDILYRQAEEKLLNEATIRESIKKQADERKQKQIDILKWKNRRLPEFELKIVSYEDEDMQKPVYDLFVKGVVEGNYANDKSKVAFIKQGNKYIRNFDYILK